MRAAIASVALHQLILIVHGSTRRGPVLLSLTYVLLRRRLLIKDVRHVGLLLVLIVCDVVLDLHDAVVVG